MKGIYLRLIVAVMTCGLTLQPILTLADTLLIEAVEKNASVQRPLRGESMSAVESRYGQADAARTVVGEPPITRWIYPEFTVYFEHSHVIHSVVNRK